MEFMSMIKPVVEEDRGLGESCEQYIGTLLSVEPIHGWGWAGNMEEPNPPEKFNVRLERLFWVEGIRRGGVGKVESPGHIFHNYTAVFDTRHYGEYNFTGKIGAYNISLTQSELYEKEGWPLSKDPNDGCGGYCEIRAARNG